MGPPLFASVLSSKFQVPKKTLQNEANVNGFPGCLSPFSRHIRPSPIQRSYGGHDSSDEEVAQYAGIIDLIPGVANVIQQLVPVMQEQMTILIDPNMDFNAKVGEMMKVCVQHAPEIVQVVGDFGLKVIVQAVLPGIIAAFGGR